MACYRRAYRLLDVRLVPLLCLFVLTGLDCHPEDVTRDCAHSSHVEPEVERHLRLVRSIPLETHRSANHYYKPQPTRRLLEDNGAEPIRIHVVYQLGNLPDNKARFMKEKLIPVMQGVFKRSLKIKKPIRGKFYLPWECTSFFPGYPGYCHKVGHRCLTAKHDKTLFGEGRTCIQPYDDQCIRLPKGEGVEADFILYVTAKEEAGCLSGSETVATAGFCIHDYDNWYGLPGRPLAGAANFCPSNIYTEEKMFSFMLDTAVHEVIHALVMSKSLFGMYLTDEGQSRSNAVIERGGHLTVMTPNVVKAAREILDCPTMNGAKLENEGGYGTADSHWERRLFMGELMIGTASATSRVILSNLTLALAADSGWYVPNYKSSGVLSSVEHRGCGFVESDCHRYNKDLEDTFCWDDRPVSKQTAICSADHMAVGYCNNAMTLVGGCYTIMPFSNLHCTKPDQGEKEKYAVDIGLRRKPGARCFQVESFKIQRTEDYMSVYRNNPGAVCLDAACDGKKLYIHIPATKEHEEGYIHCPTGGYVDLTEYDLGFDEGKIGPCPNNKLVCESWGCPDDCNSHGRCMDGKCYCDLGYVGKDCKNRPCPEHACKDGYRCDIRTGLCFPGGFEPRPKIESPTEPQPKPKKKSKQQKGSKPKSSPKSEPKPEDEPFVPATKPQKEKKPTKPSKTPTVPQVPTGPKEEEIGVPAYGDDGTSGKAIGVGYLHNCLLFEDRYGDRKVHADSIREYTEMFGQWSFESYPRDDLMVIDPDYGDCYDMFTDLRPNWRARGFKTVRTLSAISTLAALTPKADDYYEEEQTLARKRDDASDNRYAMERRILHALGLKDKYILQRDFILESYLSDDLEAKRAIVFNAMIVNTVVQVSCFVDASTMPSFRTSDLMFRILGVIMEQGVKLNRLVYTDTVYLIVDRISDKTTNGRYTWILSEVVARVNKMAYSYLSRYSGVELLDATSRLMKIAQKDLCVMGAELRSGDMPWPMYQDQTSKRSLRKMIRSANIPDIISIMSQEPDDRDNDTRMHISFLDSHKKEVLFVGGAMVILVVAACVIFAVCRRRSRPSGA